MHLKLFFPILFSLLIQGKTFASGNETGNPLSKLNTIEHENCAITVSTGTYMTLNPYFNMPWEEINKKLEDKLKDKGYDVVKLLKYTTDSRFGNSGIEDASKRDGLAAEFRISCTGVEESKEHRCQASLKAINPKNENDYSVKDSDGKPVGAFKTNPAYYDKELETGLSSWRPLSWQSGDVFDGVLKDLPKCTKRVLNPNEIIKSAKVSSDFEDKKAVNDSTRSQVKEKQQVDDLTKQNGSSTVSK